MSLALISGVISVFICSAFERRKVVLFEEYCKLEYYQKVVKTQYQNANVINDIGIPIPIIIVLNLGLSP
ncbi:MAG: hypothetical protein IPO23_04870 [Flavobacterium sp.]|nr:hypothetical protein [Flavobacterium sp.]